MPFTVERAERLKELLLWIESNGEDGDGELSYLAVPYLKKTDETVKAQLSESAPDRETLHDSAVILHYLARAYDRLGRFAVSAAYYQRAIALAAALAENHGEHIEDESTMVYNALKARNYYVDDDCADLRPLALAFLGEATTADVFETVMSRRRNLKHDPVEATEEYLAVIDEVDEWIEKNREYRGFGSCHHVWRLKAEYLAKKGITWRSPAALNPRVRFD